MYSFGEMKKFLGIEISKTDEELQIEFSNTFFYANVCQFCSIYYKNLNMRICVSCMTLFYCNTKHPKSHWSSHGAFCEAIRFVMAESKKDYIFQDMPHDPRAALEYKYHFLASVTSTMNRKPYAYELNMFMFPRVCLICSESNPSLLRPCSKCPHANFCTKHLNDKGHETHCSMFTFCYYLDQYWILFKNIHLEEFVEAIPHNIQMEQLPNTMDMFLDTHVKPYHPEMDLTVPEVRMLVSKNFTRSLTVIYAMKKSQVKVGRMLLIHVLSHSKYQEINYIEWEVLFHWFPKLKFITVIFIGTEHYSTETVLEICPYCHAKKKILRIATTPLMYKQYCGSDNRKPNLIVGFDVDPMSQFTCDGSSTIFTDMNVPIVLTSNDEINLVKALQYTVDISYNQDSIGRNPFASLRPERCYESISYSNYYLSIYRNVFLKITESHLEDFLAYDSEAMKGEKTEDQDTNQEQSREVAIKNDKEENFVEEKILIEEENLIVEDNLIAEENVIEEEKKEKISKGKKAYDIDEAETHLELMNDILFNAERRNTTLKREVKLYRNAIADSNEFSKTTEALHKELNDLSEKYYDLETRMIEHFGLEFNEIRHLLESAP